MKSLYKISIDNISPQYVSGWCFARFNRVRRVRLELFYGSEKIGTTVADMFREDLRELGMHPDGMCGFEFVFNTDDRYNRKKTLTIRPKGSHLVLAEIAPDGSVTPGGNLNFLAGLVRRYVGATGRENKNMLFMHVPKTAGTSFNTLVGALLPKEGIVAHIELKDPMEYERLQRSYYYISGHLRIGVFKEFFNLDRARLYTIVREPYSHLHSHLKWLIKTSTASNDNYFKYSNPVIYELGQELSCLDLGNKSNLIRFVDGLQGISAAFFDNMQTRYFLDEEPDRVSEGDFIEAVTNIKLFTLIGVTEYYFDFIDEFKRINNIDRPTLQKRLNRSTSPPLFDWRNKRIREILYPLVRFDLDLYERIKKRNSSLSSGRNKL